MDESVILEPSREFEETTYNELWKPIPGEERYEVSSNGRVRVLRRSNRWGDGSGQHILKAELDRGGYQRVTLYPKRKHFFVHVLVLNTFAGPCPSGMECRHFPDPSRTNNRLDNLQWGTRLENNADKAIHGSAAKGERHGSHTKPERRARGTKINTAKLTESDVLEIRLALSAGASQRGLARRYGVSQSPIYQIKHGLSWKHVTTKER